MSFSSLGTAVSGLNAAQAGLYVVGHNMANSGIDGYTRQRVVQKDAAYNYYGVGGNGVMKMGLGTDVQSIQQIRNRFLDSTYRRETSRLGYYTARADTGKEIETVIGELQSQYNAQSVIHDVWNSLSELMEYPSGLDTRGVFLENCEVFIDKMNNVYDRLFNYQHNLDVQIRDMVGNINDLVGEVNILNGKIAASLASGENPNDLRDRRDLCLDTLSNFISIDYSEGKNGSVSIFTEGKELLANGFQTKIGLRYVSGEYSFVEPVFTTSTSILSSSEFAIPLFNYKTSVSADADNDKGALKGLFYARGLMPANYAVITDPSDPNYDEKKAYNVKNFMIPSVMNQLDTIFNRIVTLINDAIAPYAPSGAKDTANAPYDISDPVNQSFVEVFSRVYVDRWDGGGAYNEENPNDYYSLYSIGNIVINPALKEEGGLKLISLSKLGDIDDPNLLLELLDGWKAQTISLNGSENLDINSAYQRFVTGIGSASREALSYVDEQSTLVMLADSKRMSISGVSLDEEMKNMMMYQHAYNASARILNAIDSMIDKIVNGTGRVGR